MKSFEIDCPNPDCRYTINVDPSKWGDEEVIDIYCPRCTNLVKRYNKVYQENRDDQDTTHYTSNTIIIKPRKIFTNEYIKQKKVLAWLVALDSQLKPLITYNLGYGKQTIGREKSSKKSDIGISTIDKYISGCHCIIEGRVTYKGTLQFLITDNFSKNGTILNGSKTLDKDEIYCLIDGTLIQLGNSKFLFVSIESVNDPVQAIVWADAYMRQNFINLNQYK